MPILEQKEVKSCEGCVHLDTSLFLDPFWGDCNARKKIEGVVDRGPNARAPWGHCGPERKNYTPKQK